MLTPSVGQHVGAMVVTSCGVRSEFYRHKENLNALVLHGRLLGKKSSCPKVAATSMITPYLNLPSLLDHVVGEEIESATDDYKRTLNISATQIYEGAC